MKQKSSLAKARESVRLQSSYNTISLYGMDFVLDRGIIGTTRRFFLEKLWGVPQPPVPVPLPVKARLLLQELGPIYVKVGQLISSQAQALPPEWAEQFSRLQSNVRPFPYDLVNEIIIAKLGASPEELFASFDDGDDIRKLSGSIVSDGDVTDFKISPDGKWVAYLADQNVDQQFELFVVPSESGTPVNISDLSLPKSDVEEFKWAPDDSGIAYIADQDTDETFELYASEPNGNNNTKLSGILIAGGDVFSFDWIP